MTHLPDNRTGETKPEPMAVANWENEGGHLPNPRRVAITPTDVSLCAKEPPPGSDELAAMRSQFEADFALIARRRDSLRHRSRDPRQSAEAGPIREAVAQPQ